MRSANGKAHEESFYRGVQRKRRNGTNRSDGKIDMDITEIAPNTIEFFRQQEKETLIRELLYTIKQLKIKVQEQDELVQRLQDRHSEYKVELWHMVELSNKWFERWKKLKMKYEGKL